MTRTRKQKRRVWSTETTRAKISETVRRQHADRKAANAGPVWTDERIARLKRGYAKGGWAGAARALPEMSEGAVKGAVRRYCLGSHTAPRTPAEAQQARLSAPSPWNDPNFHRRFLEVLTGRSQL